MPRKKSVKPRVVMPRQPDETWFKKQITIGNLLSVGTVVVAITGVYFTTTATLTAQGSAIASVERKLVDLDKKDERQQAAVLSERQSLRTEMTDRAERTAIGLADLGKAQAVLSTQLLAIRDDLVRLSAQVANLPGGQMLRK